MIMYVSASYIKPCARSDPNFNSCALEHAKETFPYFVKGKCLKSIDRVFENRVLREYLDLRGMG
jgi:hypothetical protein